MSSAAASAAAPGAATASLSHNVQPPVITAVNAILFGLVTITVVSRLWFRILRKAFGLDDFLILIAYGFTVGFAVAMQLTQIYGGRLHIWDVQPYVFVQNIKANWVVGLCFYGAAGFGKLSIVAFYRRVQSSLPIYRGGRKGSIALGLLAIASIVYAFGSIIFLLFTCKPISYFWNRFYPTAKGHCLSTQNYGIFNSAYNTALDGATFLISFFFISHLDLPPLQRILLYVIMGVGVITCLVSIVRTYLYTRLILHSTDATWDDFAVLLLATVEIHLGILVACFPACKTIIESWLEKRTGPLEIRKLSFAKPV